MKAKSVIFMAGFLAFSSHLAYCQSGPPPGAPGSMRLCNGGTCKTLIWNRDHYDGVQDGENSVGTTFTITRWQTDRIELSGKSVNPLNSIGAYYITGVFTGRISPAGNSIVDGEVKWQIGPESGKGPFRLTWDLNSTRPIPSSSPTLPPGAWVLPAKMRLCAINCFTLVLNGDHYDAFTENRNPNVKASTYYVVSFSPDSVIMTRIDGQNQAKVTGRVTDPAVSIATGTIVFANGGKVNYALAWGNTINAISRVDQDSIAKYSVKAESARLQPGYTLLQYPGTNFPTQLTAINDRGVAVGFYKLPPRPTEIECDSDAFGAPCPPANDPTLLEIPHAFSYANGKFTRLKGKLSSTPNNRPIAINNKGKVLVQHGRFTNVPMQAGFDYFIYDLATGEERKIQPIDGSETLILQLFLLSGLNDKEEVSGFGHTTSVEPSRNVAGLFVGAPNTSLLGNDSSTKPTNFKQIDVSFSGCPKQDRGQQYGNMKFVGPNNKAQVAVSCGREVAIYDVNARTAIPLTLPADMGLDLKAISNSGEVAGCSGGRAVIYRTSGPSILPMPEEGACAMGINVAGQIVGYMADKAFIYSPTH